MIRGSVDQGRPSRLGRRSGPPVVDDAGVTDVCDHPLELLRAWIADAQRAGHAHPASVAFVTASADGHPSARTVTLKRVEAESLIFTSALWTRKAREVAENPHVALLFHWPALGRQVHVSAVAEPASRALAEELFAERDSLHRSQAVVSRQGEPIDDLRALFASSTGRRNDITSRSPASEVRL